MKQIELPRLSLSRGLFFDPSGPAFCCFWLDNIVEVPRCRGDAHQHRFAIQLCALRSSGCFVDEFTTVPLPLLRRPGPRRGVLRLELADGWARNRCRQWSARGDYGDQYLEVK